MQQMLLHLLVVLLAWQGAAARDEPGEGRPAGDQVNTYLLPALRFGPNNQKRDLRFTLALAQQLGCGVLLSGLHKHYSDRPGRHFKAAFLSRSDRMSKTQQQQKQKHKKHKEQGTDGKSEGQPQDRQGTQRVLEHRALLWAARQWWWVPGWRRQQQQQQDDEEEGGCEGVDAQQRRALAWLRQLDERRPELLGAAGGRGVGRCSVWPQDVQGTSLGSWESELDYPTAASTAAAGMHALENHGCALRVTSGGEAEVLVGSAASALKPAGTMQLAAGQLQQQQERPLQDLEQEQELEDQLHGAQDGQPSTVASAAVAAGATAAAQTPAASSLASRQAASARVQVLPSPIILKPARKVHSATAAAVPIPDAAQSNTPPSASSSSSSSSSASSSLLGGEAAAAAGAGVRGGPGAVAPPPPPCLRGRVKASLMEAEEVLDLAALSAFVPVTTPERLRQEHGWDGTADALMHSNRARLKQYKKYLAQAVQAANVSVPADVRHLQLSYNLGCNQRKIEAIKQQIQGLRVVIVVAVFLSNWDVYNVTKEGWQPPPVGSCPQSVFKANRLLRPSALLRDIADRFIRAHFSSSQGRFVAIHLRPYPDECLLEWLRDGPLDSIKLGKHCHRKQHGMDRRLVLCALRRLRAAGHRSLFVMTHPGLHQRVQAMFLESGSGVEPVFISNVANYSTCQDSSSSFLALVEDAIALRAQSFIGTSQSSITESVVLGRLGLLAQQGQEKLLDNASISFLDNASPQRLCSVI